MLTTVPTTTATHDAGPPHTYSFGIEEEYFIVCPKTKKLDDRSHGSLLKACKKQLGSVVRSEMLQSQIEISSPILMDFTQARQELRAARRVLCEIATEHGLGLVAAGTYPLAAWEEQRLTKHDRYRQIHNELQIVGRRNVLCGMHVHVQPPVNASRIDLMNRVLPYLPVLLALSTSSPFWQTHRTGMKGYRLAAYDELPRTGLPPVFSNDGEYQLYISALTSSGAMSDASHIWWAIRPSPRYPTLELRIADSCTHLEDSLCIAAIFRCLIRCLVRNPALNAIIDPMWRYLIDENRWRAQRFGIEGSFIDSSRTRMQPVAEVVDELLALIALDADELDCCSEIEHARVILSRGTSADQQLNIYQQARREKKTRRRALVDVVDWLLTVTQSEVAC